MIAALPVSRSAVTEIPRTIHQIWVGSEPPDWVRDYWGVWDEFAEQHGFEIHRWGNDDLDRTLSGVVARRYGLNPVGIANFLRVEALAVYGGIYVDSDTVPLRPLDEWVGARPSWAGQGDRWHEGRDNNSNAVLGFAAEHPFLTQVWEQGIADMEAGLVSTQRHCGSKTWQKVWREQHRYDVEFPHGPFQVMHDPHLQATMAKNGLDLDWLRDLYRDAVTVHFFYRSWMPKSIHHKTWFGVKS